MVYKMPHCGIFLALNNIEIGMASFAASKDGAEIKPPRELIQGNNKE
jgi:hypothetical protein